MSTKEWQVAFTVYETATVSTGPGGKKNIQEAFEMSSQSLCSGYPTLMSREKGSGRIVRTAIFIGNLPVYFYCRKWTLFLD